MMRTKSKRILAGIVIILFLCGVLYAIAGTYAHRGVRDAENNGRPCNRRMSSPEIAADRRSTTIRGDFR
jgi:hypothetical protein